MRRRTLNLVIGGALLAPAFSLLPTPVAAQGVDLDRATAPRFEGPPEAKVTLIEYFSLTCPHCASFHAQVYPGLKEKYFDTGRARLEYRDFPLDQWALRAAAMARAAAPEKYSGLVGVLFKQQPQWTRSNNIVASLKLIGQLAGLSAAEVEAAMTNEALIDFILKGRIAANEDFGVDSTPSFVLDGKKIAVRDFTVEAFSDVLEGAGA